MGVLIVCDGVLALEEGKLNHEHIIQNGYELEAMGSNLIHMYAKCESLDGGGF